MRNNNSCGYEGVVSEQLPSSYQARSGSAQEGARLEQAETSSSRKSRNREQTIELIRQETAQLLAEGGVKALTHRAIAARTGYSLGTVTKYFPSALELKTAAMRTLAERWEEEINEISTCMRKADEAGKSWSDALAAHLHGYLCDTAVVRSESALVGQGLYDEGLREISLQWYENFSSVLCPYVSANTARAISEFFDGSMMMVGITGQTPQLEHVRSVLRALATLDETWSESSKRS